MNIKFKISTLSVLAALSGVLVCSLLTLSNSNTHQINAADKSSLVVNSVCGKAVRKNRVILQESEYNCLLNHQDTLSSMIDYSASNDSVISFAIDDGNDILVCRELSSNQSTYNLEVEVEVESPFAGSNIKQDIYANAFMWNSTSNAFERDDIEDQYYYSQLCEGSVPVAGNAFYSSFNISLENLDRYGEFQVTITEKESKEMRLVFRADDVDKLIVFTDQRDNSPYEAKNDCETINGYQQEWIKVEVVYYNNVVSFVCDNSLVRSFSLGDMDAHLLLGAGNITAKINNITSTFDVDVVEAKARSFSQTSTYGVTKTLTGRGTPELFAVDGNTIHSNMSGVSTRSFAALSVNGKCNKSEQFIAEGIIKTNNTGDAALGKAGKIELQLYTANSDFIKFFIYRYTSGETTFNNSFYVEVSNGFNGESIALSKVKDNCFPIGAGPDHFYSLRYEIVYDNGQIYCYLNNQLFYEYDSGWGDASLCIGVNGYANATWYKTNYIDNPLLIKNRLRAISPFNENHSFGANTYFMQGNEDVFAQDESGYFIKNIMPYGNGYLYNQNNLPVAGSSYYAEFGLFNNDSLDWGQAEIIVAGDDLHMYRFVLEKCANGEFQVFKESKNGNSYWTNYELIVANDPRTSNHYRFAILVNNGQLHLLIDGLLRETYPITYSSHVGVGGKDAIIMVKNITSEIDASAVSQLENNLKPYVQKSKYEKRIVQYEEKYASYPDGGLLLMGSSSLDYWNTYQEDLSEIDVVYNCGIGGTGITDWQNYMMERLVYNHSPSTILMYLGGNEISSLPIQTIINKIRMTLLEIHERLPSTHIYILGQKPAIRSKKTLAKYQQINVGQQGIVAQYSDFLTYIDNWDYYYNDQGNIERSYFVDDGMHLTAEGYVIWKNVIRKGLGLE